ncbi:MAG: DUF6529 family protein [Conexibacter sp.]
MEELVERLARGNVAEVKTVLATVVLALAVYQLALIAIAYGRTRPPFLQGRPAALAHRAIGDTLVALIAVVAFACLVEYGFDDDVAVHAGAGVALLGVLASKIGVLRVHRGGRLLPLLGGAVFALVALTWLSSTGGLLGDD